MAIEDLLRKKRAEIIEITSRRGARNVRIFGSVSKGLADAESDIDIVVDMEPGRSLMDLGGLWWELNALLGVKVDVVTEKGLRPRIRERVLREAVSL
jgi:predicted nucleotidyltransferase